MIDHSVVPHESWRCFDQIVEVGSGTVDRLLLERSAIGVEITWNLVEHQSPFSGAIEQLRIIMRLKEIE
jgi:hypothetical protein